jgi:hypothetical protein
MNSWLDILLVTLALLASVGYAIYALGPKRVKQAYSRFATKHFGLGAARWFRHSADSCDNCPSNQAHKNQH